MRVFEGVYKLDGKTIGTLDSWIALDKANYSEFHGYRDEIIQKCRDSGSRSVRTPETAPTNSHLTCPCPPAPPSWAWFFQLQCTIHHPLNIFSV